MAQMTSEQANALANNFLGLAQAIGDYRYAHWNALSKDDNQQLGSLQWSTLNYGEDILAFSTTLVMDDVNSALKQINGLTLQIKSTIQKLQNVGKAIKVATAIVTLGAAVMSADPEAINNALHDALEIWKKTKP
jgi:hypothetical protein